MPRTFPALLAALTLVVGGCGAAGQSQATDVAHQASAMRTATPTRAASRPRIPSDPPFYGTVRPGDTVRTSGHRTHPVRRLPFTDGILTEGQLKRPADKNGVRDYVNHGIHYKHPVAIAQYGLAKLDVAQRKHSATALKQAEANGAALLASGVPHGKALFFPYPFDFNLGGEDGHTIHTPWWSAMAQGEALSLFVRLWNTTHQDRWRKAANRTFASFAARGPRPKGQPWTTYVDKHGYLWFEEYAGDTVPLIVLNGDMFALFGIYDYATMKGAGVRTAAAEKLFDAGVTTLREYLPLYRVKGQVSYYCLRQPFCHDPSWQNEKYHGIVYRQMRFIADMTDDPWFRHEAKLFNQDHDSWPLKPEWYK